MTANDVPDAVIEYFASRSHEAWRRTLLRTNPGQKGRPRMRLRGGVMVDVNQPWTKLNPKAQQDNKIAARDAYQAVKRFPNNREAAAAYVHRCWIKRNKGDPAQPKALFKPYSELSEIEKDKDRAHVDNMKNALTAVAKRAGKVTSRPRVAKRKPGRARSKGSRSGFKTVRVDSNDWRRLETAADQLSELLGRRVTPNELLGAGVRAILEICGPMRPRRRQ